MGHASIGNEYTRAVADYVSKLQYEDVPADVLHRLKLLVLDSLGCALYSANLQWSRILQDTLRAVDTSEVATIIGTSRRSSAPHAALINGTHIQGFELDDVHRQGVLHVGAVTLPALLAATDIHRGGLSGRDFLAAALAGYEVGPRVGICMGQEHVGQGWHSGATVGVFAGAAAASRAMDLTPEQTVHALGIAGTQSAGLMAAQFGAMVKRMHAGRSSQSGLYGALLAANGFTGIIDVFEAPYGGFCTTFSRSTDRFDLEELRKGFGSVYQTKRIALKFYSCVGSNHTTLDAVRAIRERRPFEIAELDKIVVHGSQVTVDHVGWEYRPEGLTSAQLNLPYCVATLLLDGDVFVDQFKDELVADPERMQLLKKVTVLHDPAITAQGSNFRHKVRVEVHLKDGSVHHEEREAPRGSEKSFASDEDIFDKFRKLSAKVLPAGHQQQLIDAVMNLERLPDARQLTALLSVH
ncbi:MmgE/PrpD family protein [Terrihabitans soli]|uniref:MmgE/PrpD family protein n=1 Tax=Terrihabitans soli TaxID=708113 RepID=A0A6S6QP48_9HYPH|nr:MmgE/PrpD family protein [Terrihabitans soli]BCJ91246.1 MmgE/PrpD family protein [Terrihabitans soli]